MKHILVEIMSSLTSLAEEEKTDIKNSFPVKEFKKGTHLLSEGQIARNAYLVICSCVREYEIVDGNENHLAVLYPKIEQTLG